jgi:transcriptional regulator with XRE-family HTH domain
MANTVGQRIAELRAQKGWNQTQLAEKASLSRNAISRIEHGHTIPSVPTVEKISRALGEEPGALFPKAKSLQGLDVDSFFLEVLTEARPESVKAAYAVAYERFAERFKEVPESEIKAEVESLSQKQHALANDPDDVSELIRVMEKRNLLKVALKAAEDRLAAVNG